MLRIRVIDHASGDRAEFEAGSDEPLLDQLQGSCPFSIPNLCWMGACGTCALRVSEGLEHLEPDAFGVGATVEVDRGYVLPCAAGVSETAAGAEHAYRVTLEVG